VRPLTVLTFEELGRGIAEWVLQGQVAAALDESMPVDVARLDRGVAPVKYSSAGRLDGTGLDADAVPERDCMPWRS
jgi:hypothetical protein